MLHLLKQNLVHQISLERRHQGKNWHTALQVGHVQDQVQWSTLEPKRHTWLRKPRQISTAPIPPVCSIEGIARLKMSMQNYAIVFSGIPRVVININQSYKLVIQSKSTSLTCSGVCRCSQWFALNSWILVFSCLQNLAVRSLPTDGSVM